jgi:hypothetical protein
MHNAGRRKQKLMQSRPNLTLPVFIFAAVLVAAPRPASAQVSAPEMATDHQNGAPVPNVGLQADTPKPSPHRFWDSKNDLLFAGVAASRALDYSSTLNMRRRGRQEILLTNDVVDNHPAFAAIEVAGTAVSIGASYLFHHYGRHKLERWTSIIHATFATSGAIRNYSLKTAHPAPLP